MVMTDTVTIDTLTNIAGDGGTGIITVTTTIAIIMIVIDAGDLFGLLLS